jgi:hypothetical protein
MEIMKIGRSVSDPEWILIWIRTQKGENDPQK